MAEINEKDYYGLEAARKWMSASQFKEFRECEAKAMAHLEGLYQPPESDACAIGKFFDAKCDSQEAYDKLMLESRPKYFKKDGSPRAETLKALKAYERAYRDPMFKHFVADGEHQAIFTGEIAGVPYKGKLDSYFPGEMIVDLKYMRDMENKYIDGEWKTFIDAWGYDLQLAVYRELVAQNNGGQYLPCFIAAVTKESTPRIGIIEVPDWKLNSALEIIKHYSPIYQDIKDGKRAPERCEKCAYCRETYRIEKPTKYEDLLAS